MIYQLEDRHIELITRHDSLRNVKHFELYCLPALVGFYIRHGFGTDVGRIQLMRRENSAIGVMG